MNTKHIVVIGNSVALRVRPPEVEQRNLNKTYAKILEETLNESSSKTFWLVHNHSISRYMVDEAFRARDHLVSYNADFYIINLGCVEVPNREIPRWYSDIIFDRKLKIVKPLMQFIYNNMIKRVRYPLVQLRGFTPWISKKKFLKIYGDLLKLILKETSAQILMIGINEANENIDAVLPKTSSKYHNYNNALKEMANAFKVKFIGTEDFQADKHFPDNVHYNQAGHQLLTNKILKAISENEY